MTNTIAEKHTRFLPLSADEKRIDTGIRILVKAFSTSDVMTKDLARTFTQARDHE